MPFKKILRMCAALCITAILVIAVCGCEDLGAYESAEEYYATFGDDDGDIFLVDSKGAHDYSVEEYFYNEESKENFLTGDDGVYAGVPYSEYIYMAIPFQSDVLMDSLALYMRSEADVSVFIRVFAVEAEDWSAILENLLNPTAPEGQTAEDAGQGAGGMLYPDEKTKIGDIKVTLKKGKWGSFVLDTFQNGASAQKSIQIKEGQYVLLQIRNNGSIPVFDPQKQEYVDPETGLALSRAEITMTNLLIRALEAEDGEEAQGGE